MPRVDVLIKGVDVIHTPSGQRLRVGFVKGMEFIDGIFGAAVVDVPALMAALPSGGSSCSWRGCYRRSHCSRGECYGEPS